MTWAELQRPGPHTPATEIDPTGIDLAALRRLQELRLDDIDALWELHINGLVRLWGLRVGRLFECIWFDPQHQVFPAARRRARTGN